MGHQQHGYADREHGSKPVGCLGCNLQATKYDQKNGKQGKGAPQQSRFFGQNGENENEQLNGVDFEAMAKLI